MRDPTHIAACALLYLLGARLLPGAIMGTESLDKLLAASDTIVVGSIVQGTVSGTAVTGSIQVERVLKGNWRTGQVIGVAGTISQPSPTRTVADERGIFFLAGNGSGPVRLVSVTSGFLLDERFLFLPLPDASSPADPPASSSPRERVLLEILAGMEAGTLKRPGGFIEPEFEYRAAPTPAARTVFRRWLTSGSQRLVASSLQALLAEGDTTALARVSTDPALRRVAAEAHAFDGLKGYFKNTDPAAVRALGELAGDNSNSMELRIAAASALARIHTRQALPFLAQLLDSPDVNLRVLGVGGLSMFANHVPIGSHEPAAGDWPWRTEETIAHSGMEGSNVGFWKSWWAANQAALLQ